MGQLDDLTKALVRANPQAFVSLFCPGAQFVALLDKELKEQRTIFADILIKMLWKWQDAILHQEFQYGHDAEMGRRMWEYNYAAMHAYNCVVASFVLYLLPDTGIVEPPYTVSLPDESKTHIFFYKSVKVWELSGELLQQPGLEGLLPLLPLTKMGATREMVEVMLAALKAAHKEDLYPLAYGFASLVFKQPREKEWLKRRFNMLKREVPKEAWAYWEMYQEATEKAEEQGLEKGLVQGLEKGLVQGLEKGLVQGEEKGERETWRASLMLAVNRLFPALTTQAELVGRAVEDPKRLQQIVSAVFVAQTEEAARQVLRLPD